MKRPDRGSRAGASRGRDSRGEADGKTQPGQGRGGSWRLPCPLSPVNFVAVPGPAGVYGRLTHRPTTQLRALGGRGEGGRQEGGGLWGDSWCPGRAGGDKTRVPQGQGQPHSTSQPNSSALQGSPPLSPNSTLFHPGPLRQILPPAPLPLQSHTAAVLPAGGPVLPPLVFCRVPQVRSPRHSDSSGQSN